MRYNTVLTPSFTNFQLAFKIRINLQLDIDLFLCWHCSSFKSKCWQVSLKVWNYCCVNCRPRNASSKHFDFFDWLDLDLWSQVKVPNIEALDFGGFQATVKEVWFSIVFILICLVALKLSSSSDSSSRKNGKSPKVWICLMPDWWFETVKLFHQLSLISQHFFFFILTVWFKQVS